MKRGLKRGGGRARGATEYGGNPNKAPPTVEAKMKQTTGNCKLWVFDCSYLSLLVCKLPACPCGMIPPREWEATDTPIILWILRLPGRSSKAIYLSSEILPDVTVDGRPGYVLERILHTQSSVPVRGHCASLRDRVDKIEPGYESHRRRCATCSISKLHSPVPNITQAMYWNLLMYSCNPSLNIHPRWALCVGRTSGSQNDIHLSPPQAGSKWCPRSSTRLYNFRYSVGAWRCFARLLSWFEPTRKAWQQCLARGGYGCYTNMYST